MKVSTKPEQDHKADAEKATPKGPLQDAELSDSLKHHLRVFTAHRQSPENLLCFCVLNCKVATKKSGEITMKNYSRLVIAFAVCLVAASPSLAGGGHDNGLISSVDVLSPFACAPEDCAVIGTSTLYRSADGVGANIDLIGVAPNTPFTVWAVVFNNPNNCAAFPHGACGLGDLSNLAVKAAIFWATGNYSDDDGNAYFQTFITKGNNNRIQLIPGELTNPSKAEIHFIFRQHEIVFGGEHGAINTPAGSCPSNPGTCVDIGSATHER